MDSGGSDRQTFIKQAFKRWECCRAVRSTKAITKCGCGRLLSDHDTAPLPPNVPGTARQRWCLRENAATYPTNAYGTIEFQGGPHPRKAQYVRLGYGSSPMDVMHLFEQVWGIERPKLVISVHGGIANFTLQHKLELGFRKGLLKAAKTTGAWIITSGINSGVVQHVAAALSDVRSKNKIVTIGIAPWGLLRRREDFLGDDNTVIYHPQALPQKGRSAILNDKHSHFLLVDNGTAGQYGADIVLRRRLEEYISKLRIESSGKRVPVVCVVLEGGTCTIRTVLDYVSNEPPVPVVVCDGSGRAADLLAFTHRVANEDGTMPDTTRDQLLRLIAQCFDYDSSQAEKVLRELLLCVRRKHLISIFRLGEGQQQDIDHAILKSLLKGQDLSPADQLSLVLTWNRPDIARSDIFIRGTDWPPGALENAMMDALVYDRVEFVKLLLENGVQMSRFLTFSRLEQLYNVDKGPTMAFDGLKLIIKDVVKYPVRKNHYVTLHEIGLVVQKLMGGAFRATYLRKSFRLKLEKYIETHPNMRHGGASGSSKLARRMGKTVPPTPLRPPTPEDSTLRHNHSQADMLTDRTGTATPHTMLTYTQPRSPPHTALEPDFKYPFNELLLWAVLLRRQNMALCMWQHGEEALAKSLIACKLYSSMAEEAAEDYLEVEICDELGKHSETFRDSALELLAHCYVTDDDQTFRLLTYELNNWGRETCLSLAYLANHQRFVAHPACQIMLADLWHGGLRIRRHSTFRVLLGLLCPPTILTLDFKTKEELLQQPQTKVEHIEDARDAESIAGSTYHGSSLSSMFDSSSSSSSSASQSGTDLEEPGGTLEEVSVVGVGIDGDVRVGMRDEEGGRRKKRRRHSRASLAGTMKRYMNDINMNARRIHRDSTLEQNAAEMAMKLVNSETRQLDQVESEESRLSAGRERTSEDDKIRPPPGHPASRASTVLRQNSGSNLPQDMEQRAQHSLLSVRNSLTVPNFQSIVSSSQATAHPPVSLASQAQMPTSYRTLIQKMSPQTTNRPLTVGRKLYEFYVAPITTFWFFALSYIVFLIVFTYLVLVRTPDYPTIPEYLVLIYILTYGCEIVRKFLMCETPQLRHKARVFFQKSAWGPSSAVFVVLFIFAFCLRFHASTSPYSRLFYAIDIVYWYIAVLDLLSVNQELGPYITMVARMVRVMLYMIVIMCVVLMSFGIIRQSLLFPNEEFDWLLVRNIFYKPYFMLYGEVYAPEIDTCGDEGVNCEVYRQGGFITIIFMAAFLLVSNILLINLLIAAFNSIYLEVSAVSHEVWKYQRYQVVMEYEQKPFLPPPLVIVQHMILIYRYFIQRGSRKRRLINDYGLKLFLSDDEVEKIHDFEEECMDELFQQREIRKFESQDQRIQRTDTRVEFLSLKLDDMTRQQASLKSNTQDLECRSRETIDLLRVMTTRMAALETAQNQLTLLLSDLSLRYTPSHDTPAETRKVPAIVEPEPVAHEQPISASPTHVPQSQVANFFLGDKQHSPVAEPSTSHPETGPGRSPAVLRTAFSCPATADSDDTSPTVLRRRHRRPVPAYTTITDHIDESLEDLRLSGSLTAEEMHSAASSGSQQHLPHSASADMETPREQETILRQFEEEGGRVTAGLVRQRMRRTSEEPTAHHGGSQEEEGGIREYFDSLQERETAGGSTRASSFASLEEPPASPEIAKGRHAQ